MFKKITRQFDYEFNVPKSGFYRLSISASCKSGKLLGIRGGEDLRVKIDGRKLREVPTKDEPQYKDIPPAWNGTKLKGLSKTVIFILWLEQGEHTIKFIPYRGATIEKEPEIVSIRDSKNIVFDIEKQAEDGNRRPWITFVLINLPLSILDVSVKCSKRFLDSDDVKLIIDEDIQKNKQASWWAKNWYWQGRRLQGETEETRFYPKLSKGIHYIEFWADRKPTLNWVEMNLGEAERKKEDRLKAKVTWDSAILRREPKQDEENILQKLKKGDEVFILEKAVPGERPLNSKGKPLPSDRWHKVEFQGEVGYIYSMALEIEGEDKETIRKFILKKAKELKEDSCLMLAIAKRESILFPYMVSKADAQGIFQLKDKAVSDVNSEFEKDFKNRFDINQNVEAGILYFQLVKRKYKGRDNFWERCLAGWNRGWGKVRADKPFVMSEQPIETQQFIQDVFKFWEECKNNLKKSGKALLFLLMLIGAMGVIGLILFSLPKEPFPIPFDYADHFILTDEKIDIDRNGDHERIVVVNDDPNSTFGITKILLIQKNGSFLELPDEGLELQWFKVEDFNKNGKMDIAVLYGYSGSAGFGQFYLYEWSGSGFTTLFSREEIESEIEFKDLDDDGAQEILYSFKQSKWDREQTDVYKWNKENLNYGKSLF